MKGSPPRRQRESYVSRLALPSGWTPFHLPVRLTAPDMAISFGFVLPQGGTATVWGLQVEAQPSPSGYKRTRARSGVYANTRFEQDSLTLQADGVNDYSTKIRLVSRL